MKRLFLIFGCSIAFVFASNAQQVLDSTNRRNTIKLDLTSHWLYRNALIFSYERTIKPNRSFCITGGYQELPHTSNLGSRIAVREDNKKYGLKFGGEYRFYLAKENKYQAPHGVYIGPYFTFHQFKNERTIEVDVDSSGTYEQANLTTKFQILNIGFQLGYQFVLNNRWTIDLVFVGPSISNYRFKATVDSGHSFDTGDIQNEVILALIDRFPLLEEVIDESEAKKSGKLDVWSYGYRYQFQIGYHFGRKNK